MVGKHQQLSFSIVVDALDTRIVEMRLRFKEPAALFQRGTRD